MRIYDSVIIRTTNANNKIVNELKKEFKDRFIKIYKELKNLDYCEHDTLIIEIINNKILIEDNEILVKDIFIKYKFVSNIFSIEEDINKYKKEYAKYIFNKKNQANKIVSKYNFRKNFDFVSGSIYLSDEEYFLLHDTKLKKVIFNNKNNSYEYVIPNENGYILRGSSTYYYLLSNKGKFENVNLKHFEEFVDNYKIYFKKIINAISDIKGNKEDCILVLSVLDNIRNYLLVLINALVISNQKEDETLLYELTNSKYNVILDDIVIVFEQMINIVNNNLFDTKLIVKIINNILKYKFLDAVKNTDSKFYDKMLKSHRECDCFLENYLTVLNYLNKNKYDSNFLGTLYGGIELPLIAYFLKNKKGIIIYISLFGIYNQRHKCKLNYDEISKKINNKIKIDNVLKCILCDDNMLTGKTIQYILDSLIIQNIEVERILLINHVNMNRIYQIIDNKTLLDLSIIDKYIHGLFFSTKYSKIKFGENRKNSYLDEFNLFDLSKEYICYYIYKNKIFSANSRICNYTIGGKNE